METKTTGGGSNGGGGGQWSRPQSPVGYYEDCVFENGVMVRGRFVAFEQAEHGRIEAKLDRIIALLERIADAKA